MTSGSEITIRRQQRAAQSGMRELLAEREGIILDRLVKQYWADPSKLTHELLLAQVAVLAEGRALLSKLNKDITQEEPRG